MENHFIIHKIHDTRSLGHVGDFEDRPGISKQLYILTKISTRWVLGSGEK